MTSAPRRELLAIKQVACDLGVHVDTVRRLIRRRKIAATRVGRVFRISPAEVARYLRSHASDES